jgi:hypothetical protein
MKWSAFFWFFVLISNPIFSKEPLVNFDLPAFKNNKEENLDQIIELNDSLSIDTMYSYLETGKSINQIAKIKQGYNFNMEVGVMKGQVIHTNPFTAGDNLANKPFTDFTAWSIKIGMQNDNGKPWQAVFHRPYYGLGCQKTDLYSNEIGKPFSIFGYLGFPVMRNKVIDIYTEFQYGMASNWIHFDPITNPKNEAIGSKLTVHAAASILGLLHINKFLDLGLGYTFTHFSNGRMERPNNGINLKTPAVSLKYYLNQRPEFVKKKVGKKLSSNSFALIVGYGSHQREGSPLDSNYFNVAGLQPIYSFAHTNAFSSGLGIDLNFLWSLSATDEGPQRDPTWDNLTVGLCYQPQVTIGRLTLLGGIGVYMRHKEVENFRQLYQRLGARYNLTKQISIAVNIRAQNFYQAEFLEIQSGYHF